MVDTAFDPPLEITKFYPIAEGDCCTSNFYSLCFFCSGCVPSNNMFGHHSCLLRYVLVCPLLLSEQKWKKEYAKSNCLVHILGTCTIRRTRAFLYIRCIYMHATDNIMFWRCTQIVNVAYSICI
jgi:hypothetical protein